jgi:hypothetical protein
MANYVPISRVKHAGLHWKKPTDYGFARGEALLPLVVAELPRVAQNMPTAFVASGDTYVPVLLAGVRPGTSLLVAADGRWLGGYVPAVLRSHPFSLLLSAADEYVICVDAHSSHLCPDTEGLPLFSADGAASAAVSQLLPLLERREQSRQQTELACKALQQHGLLVPWVIPADDAAGTPEMRGLFRVDEARLNALDDQAFLQLRQAQALPMAYSQLLSMLHLPRLVGMYRVWLRSEQVTANLQPLAAELSGALHDTSGTISFAGL